MRSLSLRQSSRSSSWLCIVLGLLGCPRQSSNVTDGSAQSTQQGSAPTLPEKSDSRISFIAQEDVLVGSGEAMSEVVFDAQHPRVGIRSHTHCKVWDLMNGVYLGMLPSKSCADWRSSSNEERTTDRKQPLRIDKGLLFISPSGASGAELRIDGRVLGKSCREIDNARNSPNGEQIAASCTGDSNIYILSARTGTLQTTLALKPNQRVRSLGWGTTGLVALWSPVWAAEECACREERLLPSFLASERGPSLEACAQQLALCKAQQVTLPKGIKKSPCPRTGQVRQSVDKQRVAFVCDDYLSDLFIAEADTTTVRKELSGIELGEGRELCWRGSELWLLGGHIAVAHYGSCEPNEINPHFVALSLWSSLGVQPRIRELNSPPGVAEESADNPDCALDPFGRYVLQSLHWRSGSALRTYDVGKDEYGPPEWTTYDNARTYFNSSYSHWLPGKFPIWETVESTDELPAAPRENRAFRIRTVPGGRALTYSPLPQGAINIATAVGDDGVTVTMVPLPGDLGASFYPSTEAAIIAKATDPSGRFLGTGKNSLRRLVDGEELFFGERGGVRTGRGLYDGPVEIVSSLVFRIGEDPARAQPVSGDQIATLLAHPYLVDDFFDGKPLGAELLETSQGLPPRLTEMSPPALRPDGGNVLFSVKGEDGGSGVSLVRRYVEGLPSGDPIPIVTGQTTAIAVSLPTTGCSNVRLYACNRLGHVCSKAVAHDFCPPGKARPDMAGQEP